MTWLTYILIAMSLVLAALPSLIIVIGSRKLERQCDTQALSAEETVEG